MYVRYGRKELSFKDYGDEELPDKYEKNVNKNDMIYEISLNNINDENETEENEDDTESFDTGDENTDEEIKHDSKKSS